MKATIMRFLTLFAEAPETRSGSLAQYLGELFCALQHLQGVEVEEIEEDPPAPDKHSLRQRWRRLSRPWASIQASTPRTLLARLDS